MDRAAVTVQAAQAAIRQAEAALGLNRSQVREAERQLDALKVTLGKTRIVAPFGGRFEEHLVEEGEVVAPGEALGRVYDLSWLRAAVDVPDRYAPLLDATNSRLQTYIMAMPGVQDLKATSPSRGCRSSERDLCRRQAAGESVWPRPPARATPSRRTPSAESGDTRGRDHRAGTSLLPAV